MKQLLMMAVAATLVLTACSDDSTTNPPASDVYVPSKTGAYVIHANEVTEEGVTSEAEDDSTVVIGTLKIKDGKNVEKTSIRHEVYIQGMAYDTMDVAEEGSKIYLSFPLELGDVGGVGAPALGTRWVLVGDQNGSTWTGLDEKFTGLNLDYNGTAIPAEIAFKVTGKKAGTENMTINGKTVSTIKYENTFAVTMTLNLGVIAPVIPISFTQTMWVGKGVGMVKMMQPATTISVPELGFEFEIPGTESTAIRYGGQ